MDFDADGEWVSAEFAKSLERENAMLRRAVQLPFGESPLKQAAWDAFYATVESELPKNPDGTHSGTYWVALMKGIDAFVTAALASQEVKHGDGG